LEEAILRKIPTIFSRDWDGDRSRVIDTPHPDCAWVFAGEGAATRKLDGTSCLVRDGKLFKRREIKKGQTAPPDFVLADHDEETGKTVGWMPVTDAAEDRWHREAFAAGDFADSTYELLGPHVQGNPERLDKDALVPHATATVYADAPRTFAELRDWLSRHDIEGLVWHHPDGRMAKIKLRDFGLKRAAQ
jgi:hypothetical protein